MPQNHASGLPTHGLHIVKTCFNTELEPCDFESLTTVTLPSEPFLIDNPKSTIIGSKYMLLTKGHPIAVPSNQGLLYGWIFSKLVKELTQEYFSHRSPTNFQYHVRSKGHFTWIRFFFFLKKNIDPEQKT